MKSHGSILSLNRILGSAPCHTRHDRYAYWTHPICAGQKQPNMLFVILVSYSFIPCMPAYQQINCSTREPSKTPHGKHQRHQMKLICHFQNFTNMPICELLSKFYTKWLSYKVQVLVTTSEDEVKDMINYRSSGQPYKIL